VAETPEQLYERVAGELRMPPVEEWDTFPFEGDMRPRPLPPHLSPPSDRVSGSAASTASVAG
jgi:hypothetical protein